MICNHCGYIMSYEDCGWVSDPPLFIQVDFYRCSRCGHTQDRDVVISDGKSRKDI